MESTKAPSATTVAISNLVAIWLETAQRRVSIYVALQDSLTVMERRRVSRKIEKLAKAEAAQRGMSAGARPQHNADSEARATYERMRRAYQPQGPGHVYFD